MLRCVVLVTLCVLVFGQRIGVDNERGMFVDEGGRVRIFHGVNVVYKTPPYHPQTDHFDPLHSLSDQDIDNFLEWGFNIVRLGVLWTGVEPKPNYFDQSYLQIMESIVDNLQQNHIYTMIDAHQDVWSRQFCGEGAPEWTVKLPDNTKRFPFPVAQPYSTINGVPSISECISRPFWPYYYSTSVSYVFQALYDNVDGLQDNFLQFWETVALHFRDKSGVIGYDLINEPWSGDIYSDPKLLQDPAYADAINLMPLYQNLTKVIRAIDSETILMYEPMGMDYATPVGFEQLPDVNSALNYHVYCGLTNVTGVTTNYTACIASWNNEMLIRMNDVKRLQTVGIMSEFGDIGDEESSLSLLEHYVNVADEYLQSTMYWQYKFYNDLTTQTPYEGLYAANGTLYTNKVKVLSRTYAYAIAGTPLQMKFHSESSLFTLEMLVDTSIQLPTEIYLNEKFYYPNGFTCEFSQPQWATWERIADKNYISINFTALAEMGQLFTITIKQA